VAHQAVSVVLKGQAMVGQTYFGVHGAIRDFLRDEDGTATIEFVLMVPLFSMVLLLLADASLLFLRHTSLMDVSRDTARIVSRYAMTPAEAKVYAEKIASTARSAATAEVTVLNGFVTVTISSDSAASAPFGMVNFAVGDQIVAQAISTMEPV
jgi:Flp pilus assembly protein TadG